MKHLDFTVNIGELLLDARVDYSEEPHYIREQSMEQHEHLLYEVYLIEKGNLALECNKTVLSLKAGDIFLISPHVTHKISSYDQDLVRFNFQFMARIAEDRPFAFLYPTDQSKKELFAMLPLIRRYLSENDHSPDAFRLNHAFSILVSYVVEPLLEQDAFLHRTQKNQRLQQLVEIDQFFFMHYAESCRVSDLAKVLNYSDAQTRRILLEYTGVSFSEKLRQHRMIAAKHHLIHSDLSVEKIAECCGYQSRMGFENVFKKSFGMTPHQFRLENGQK